MISSTLSDQISNKKEEEKLKTFSDALDKAKEDGDDEKLKKVSQQFEAFFINEIFKSMRNSTKLGEGLVEKSHARTTYEGMLDEKMSDEISSGQGIGISDLIYKQMSRRYDIGTDTASNESSEKNDSDTPDNEKKTESIDVKG